MTVGGFAKQRTIRKNCTSMRYSSIRILLVYFHPQESIQHVFPMTEPVSYWPVIALQYTKLFLLRDTQQHSSWTKAELTFLEFCDLTIELGSDTSVMLDDEESSNQFSKNRHRKMVAELILPSAPRLPRVRRDLASSFFMSSTKFWWIVDRYCNAAVVPSRNSTSPEAPDIAVSLVSMNCIESSFKRTGAFGTSKYLRSFAYGGQYSTSTSSQKSFGTNISKTAFREVDREWRFDLESTS